LAIDFPQPDNGFMTKSHAD